MIRLWPQSDLKGLDARRREQDRQRAAVGGVSVVRKILPEDLNHETTDCECHQIVSKLPIRTRAFAIVPNDEEWMRR